MTTTTGPIRWPTNLDAACRHLVGFVVRVVEQLGMQFPPELPDPLATARGFVDGSISEADYMTARDRWWGYLDRVGITDFRSKEALIGRVAICLVGAPSSAQPPLDDDLDWFFEVLHRLGADTTFARELHATYFTYGA